MAKKLYDETNISAIAHKIREKTGGEKTYNTSEMPSGIDEVYDAGYSSGYTDGETDGIEVGKQTEHDDFWERYQRKGTTDYATKTGIFNGFLFGFSNFYPKYDIRPVGAATHLFYAWENSSGDSGGSLKERLEECGVVLDTSQATNLQLAFAYTHITEIPTIDCTKCGTNSSGLFSHGYTRLRTIEKVIVNEKNTFSSWFSNTAPKEIRFEGVIANNLDISYQGYSSKQARLSKESIENIIEHLSDTVEGKTLTLSQTNIDKYYSADEWATLIANKSNWTFSLV